MKAVLDSNVLISAAIAPRGSPADLVRRWRAGDFELVVSEDLLDELTRALRYPKLRPYLSAAEAEALVGALRAEAVVVKQPAGAPTLRSRDPGDDYLLALASASGSALVSGDRDLLDLADGFPVFSPARFLKWLAEVA